MRRTVVPLVCSGNAIVSEFISDRNPRLATVIRSLDHLSKPAARLRRVDAIGIGERAFEVINLPAGEVWTADLPVLSLAVGFQNEGAFARTYQHTNLAQNAAPL